VHLVPGNPVSVEAEPGSGEHTLTVTHESFNARGGGRDAHIRCKWRISIQSGVDASTSIWTLQLDNLTTDLSVVEVLFPYLQGLMLGEEHSDDVLIFPHHAGEKIVNPAETLTSERYSRFWRTSTILEPEGYYSREINYCGLASMMWLDYYDPSGGLYMASYDPDYILTGIRSETGGPEDPWCGFGFRKYLPVRPGETWRSSPYAAAIHPGDWHWGAERYRTWALGPGGMSLPHVPADLLEQAALCPRYDFRNSGVVRHRFSEIPEMYERARREGITHFFISGWNRQGFDTDYPEYVPDMELGSSWELAEGCRYIREHGGMTTFYINVRLFDLESDYFPTLGRKWALKDSSGEMTRETYGPRTFAVLCPGCQDWRQWAVDTASWMVKAFGARGIYLDQLGSATPLPCYDQTHRHEEEQHHHGLYNHGYLEMIRAILARCRGVDPQPFLMIENCGDIYSQYLYANLTWNGDPYDEFFNVYKYTFPEFLQVNMVNPRRVPNKTLRNAWFFRDIARAFVLGSIFWVELGDRFGPDDGDLLDFAREALRLRIDAAPLIAQGTFVDDRGLRLPGPERVTGDPPWRDLQVISASRWTLPDGALLILMSNPSRRDGESVLIEAAALPRCERVEVSLHELGGSVCETSVAPGSHGDVAITVPRSELSFALLMPIDRAATGGGSAG
jgi:hypothetical protein